jgi:hypothetical protein
MAKAKQYMRDVRSLAFLIKDSGVTVIVTKSAIEGVYLCVVETLFEPVINKLTEAELKSKLNITLPDNFKH